MYPWQTFWSLLLYSVFFELLSVLVLHTLFALLHYNGIIPWHTMRQSPLTNLQPLIFLGQNNTWQRNDYLNPHRNLQKTIERFRTNDSRLHETVSLESTESFRKQSNVSESFRIERTILQENNRTLGFFFSCFCGLVARLKYDGLVKVIKIIYIGLYIRLTLSIITIESNICTYYYY